MRIRSIRPEFWRSDDIANLCREDRLLFIGLWSYVDDNGVGIDDHRLIAADLFALEDDQKEVREFVRDGLATLSRALLVIRYSLDGKSYIYIPTWDRHQRVDRPGHARYPRPPDNRTPPTSGNSNDPDQFAMDSRRTRDSLDAGEGEKGRRGEGEKTTTSLTADAARTSDTPDPFDDFWAAYPRRVDKQAARKAWRTAIKKHADPDRVIAAAHAYAAQRAGQDPHYTKHPSTWLNAGAYDNTPEPLRLVSGDTTQLPTTTARFRAAQALRRPEPKPGDTP